MGGFCKKSRNRSILVFPCPHFGVYGFRISPSGNAQPSLTFFSNGRVRQVTPRLKAHFARNTICFLNIFKAVVRKVIQHLKRHVKITFLRLGLLH
jgi:hypothetical protein